MTRNEAREILMQILFEMEVGKAMNIETAHSLAEERLTGNHLERGKKLLADIIENIESMDSAINAHSTKWKTSRMPKVDLAIVRLALGEIRYADEIPEAVSVNEAINLGKKFSTDNSAKFIHGLLGALTKDE